MLLQLLQHPSNGFHVLFGFAFGIDEDVIEVYYLENVEFFCQDLINITLKRDQYVDQNKNNYLILKMAITGPKNHLLFIAFFDSHSIVSIDQIKLGEMSSLTHLIQWFTNQR